MHYKPEWCSTRMVYLFLDANEWNISKTLDPNLLFSDTLIVYIHYQIYDKRFSALFEIFITTSHQIKVISFYLTGFSNNVKQGKHQNTFYTINVKRLNATQFLLFCNILSFFYSKVTFHQDLSFVQMEAAETKIKYFRCRKYITCSCYKKYFWSAGYKRTQKLFHD